MILLSYDLHRLVESVGQALGIRLGRAHYFQTIIVPQAVEEWLERRAADPETAAVVRPLLDDYRHLQIQRGFEREEHKRARAVRRRLRALEGHAAEDGRAVALHGRTDDRSGTTEVHLEATRTLTSLAKSGARADFIDLARMLGVSSPDRWPFAIAPEDLWVKTRKKLGLDPEEAAK